MLQVAGSFEWCHSKPARICIIKHHNTVKAGAADNIVARKDGSFEWHYTTCGGCESSNNTVATRRSWPQGNVIHGKFEFGGTAFFRSGENVLFDITTQHRVGQYDPADNTVWLDEERRWCVEHPVVSPVPSPVPSDWTQASQNQKPHESSQRKTCKGKYADDVRLESTGDFCTSPLILEAQTVSMPATSTPTTTQQGMLPGSMCARKAILEHRYSSPISCVVQQLVGSLFIDPPYQGHKHIKRKQGQNGSRQSSRLKVQVEPGIQVPGFRLVDTGEEYDAKISARFWETYGEGPINLEEKIIHSLWGQPLVAGQKCGSETPCKPQTACTVAGTNSILSPRTAVAAPQIACKKCLENVSGRVCNKGHSSTCPFQRGAPRIHTTRTTTTPPLPKKRGRGRPKNIPKSAAGGHSPEFQFGQKIEACSEAGSQYYPGTILNLKWDETMQGWKYQIGYDNKKMGHGIDSRLIRPSEIFHVERIIAKKMVKNKMMFQVKWAGFSGEEPTWEPQSHLHPQLVQCFLLGEDQDSEL